MIARKRPMRDRPATEWPTYLVTGTLRTLSGSRAIAREIKAPDREFAMNEVAAALKLEYAVEGMPVFLNTGAEKVK